MAVFDAAAESYDRIEASNWIISQLRQRSLAALRRTFAVGSRLLDVGSGTGTEAVQLSREGRSVVAIDPSPAMLDRLGAKAEAAGVVVPAHVLTASRVADLLEVYGAGSFDGAYSSFGALNLEDRLSLVAGGLAQLLRPGGAAVLSVMSRWPLMEISRHLGRLRFREAFRRTRGTISVPVVGDLATPTHFPGLGHLVESFRPEFILERQEALGLLLPPPYTWRDRDGPGTLRPVAWLDRRFSQLGPLAPLGDHHLVVLRRR